MSTKAVRLSELIEIGRGRARSEPTIVPNAARTAGFPRAPQPRPDETSRSTSIVDGIELLAVQLLSLSKTRKDNPRALMVEALRSIDCCLVAIGRKS